VTNSANQRIFDAIQLQTSEYVMLSNDKPR